MPDAIFSGVRLMKKPILYQIVLGGLAGIFILHPATMVVYWLELFPDSVLSLEVVIQRLVKSFTIGMLPMTVFFFSIGCALSYMSLNINRVMERHKHKIEYLTEMVGRNLLTMIHQGENEFQEFKSSLRWNYQSEKVDKDMELAIVKTIAGFMNNQAGTLLIGVDDDGKVLGLSNDFMTLKRKNRDGFEQYIMTLISIKIGADLCPLIHVLFHNYIGRDVCRVIIEPSPRPTYVKAGDDEKFYLRTGNTTRELTIHEAIEYISRKWS